MSMFRYNYFTQFKQDSLENNITTCNERRKEDGGGEIIMERKQIGSKEEKVRKEEKKKKEGRVCLELQMFKILSRVRKSCFQTDRKQTYVKYHGNTGVLVKLEYNFVEGKEDLESVAEIKVNIEILKFSYLTECFKALR